jgi:hypothetical protein
MPRDKCKSNQRHAFRLWRLTKRAAVVDCQQALLDAQLSH